MSQLCPSAVFLLRILPSLHLNVCVCRHELERVKLSESIKYLNDLKRKAFQVVVHSQPTGLPNVLHWEHRNEPWKTLYANEHTLKASSRPGHQLPYSSSLEALLGHNLQRYRKLV
jgi:hypothetical protein